MHELKIVANLKIDSGWVDEPNIFPCYVFNNMRECLEVFSQTGTVEIIKEPNPNNLFDFGEVSLQTDHEKFIFFCVYARSSIKV